MATSANGSASGVKGKHQAPRKRLQVGDELEPVLVATSKSWLLGWATDLGEVTSLRVAMVGPEGRAHRPVELARGEHVIGLRLAANGDLAHAAWSDGKQIWTQAIGHRGQGRVAAQRTSAAKSGAAVGPPAIVSLPGAERARYAVVWVSGQELRAAKLDAQGGVLARSRWFGGNLRPPRRVRLPKRRPGAKAPPPSKERARPLLLRPRVWAQGGKLRVRWFGGRWLSDDHGGSAYYGHVVRWGNETPAEPKVLSRPRVWDALGPSTVDTAGKLVTVVAHHSPNGGPWTLRLQREGMDGATALCSETAGPLRSALLPLSRNGLLVAWQSPARGAVVVGRVDGQGALTRRGFTNPVAPGDSAVSLARRGKEVRVAYVARRRGATHIVIADTARATDLGALTKPQPTKGEVLPETRAQYEDAVIAPWPGGGFLLVSKASTQGVRLMARSFDAQGDRSGPARPLSARLPRIDFVTAATVGGQVLVAFTACKGASICDPAGVKLAVVGPSGVIAAPQVAVPKASQAALAVHGGQVALLTKGAGWGSWTVRRVRAATGEDAAKALIKAKPLATITFADSNYAGAGALALTPQGVLVAHRDREAGRTLLRVVSVTSKGMTSIVQRLPAVDRAGWGASRLLTHDGGVALLGLRRRGRRIDTVLRLLSADGAKVRRTVVLARGMAPAWPRLASDRQGGLACSFYDRRTDGDYAVYVDSQGRRGELRRLDDPALRASFGGPLLAPTKAPRRWIALWPDPYTGHYALYKAQLEL